MMQWTDLKGNPVAKTPVGMRGQPREQTPQAKAKGKDPDPRGTELVRLSDENARLKMEVADLKSRLADALAANRPKLVSTAPANKLTDANKPANIDRKAYQRELMRKRRAAAKGSTS